MDCSRPAPAMISLTALEANSWWVPREPLPRAEVLSRVKLSPRALPIPSGAEVDCSRPVPATIPPMALEANWWWVPREPLLHEELPPRAMAPFQEPWAEARPRVQLPRLVQFRPGWRVAAAKFVPAAPPGVQSL